MKIAVYTYRSTESMRVRQAILDGIQGTPLEYDEDHPDIGLPTIRHGSNDERWTGQTHCGPKRVYFA